MKRMFIFTFAVLVVLLAFSASAAYLQVDAGTLQTWQFDVDNDICDGYEDASFCQGDSEQ